MQIGSALKVFGAVAIALALSWPTQASLPRSDTAAFMVLFRTDSATVDEQSIQTLKKHIILELDARFDGPIAVIGNCDTEEMDVSLARAEAVKAKLVELGVPASRISVHSRGDKTLLIPTPPGVSEILNRRVEIVIDRLCGKSCPPETYRDSGSSRD